PGIAVRRPDFRARCRDARNSEIDITDLVLLSRRTSCDQRRHAYDTHSHARVATTKGSCLTAKDRFPVHCPPWSNYATRPSAAPNPPPSGFDRQSWAHQFTDKVSQCVPPATSVPAVQRNYRQRSIRSGTAVSSECKLPTCPAGSALPRSYGALA